LHFVFDIAAGDD